MAETKILKLVVGESHEFGESAFPVRADSHDSRIVLVFLVSGRASSWIKVFLFRLTLMLDLFDRPRLPLYRFSAMNHEETSC
jgi:hypothetical protein